MNRPGAWRKYGGCNCIKCPPCSFCTSLTEREAEAYNRGGIALLDLESDREIEDIEMRSIFDSEKSVLFLGGAMHGEVMKLEDVMLGPRRVYKSKKEFSPVDECYHSEEYDHHCIGFDDKTKIRFMIVSGGSFGQLLLQYMRESIILRQRQSVSSTDNLSL